MYKRQGQYWLDETETSENLGVGTYFEHARNYLTACVMSAKLMLKHKVKKLSLIHIFDDLVDDIKDAAPEV